MTVIRDQAEESRQSAVGVNLDEEAANLIRFSRRIRRQHKVIQMSQISTRYSRQGDRA